MSDTTFGTDPEPWSEDPWAQQERDDSLTGRHPLEVTHLVMGLAFLGLVAVWGAVATGSVDEESLRWLLPVPWLLAGAGGLLAILLGRRRAAAAARRPDGP